MTSEDVFCAACSLATFFLLTKVSMQFAAYSEGDRKSSYIIQSVAAEVRVEYNCEAPGKGRAKG